MKQAASSAALRPLSWLRARLFSNWLSSFATLAIIYFAWRVIPPLIDWAFVHAVWSPENSRLCRDAIGQGACWAFIAEKYRFILFGTFPVEEHWRPALVIVILIGLYAASVLRSTRRAGLVVAWLAGSGDHRRADVGRFAGFELR